MRGVHIIFDELDQGLGVTAGTVVVGCTFSSVHTFHDS